MNFVSRRSSGNSSAEKERSSPWYLHTAQWWRRLWGRTGLVDVEVAEMMRDGWRHWQQFYKARQVAGETKPNSWDIEVMQADQGKYVALIRMIGKRNTAGGAKE